MTSEELIGRFAAAHFDRNSLTPRSRARALQALNTLAAQLGGRSLAELSPSDIMEWQGAELKRGMKPTTVRALETPIRVFLGWAAVEGIITTEQYARLKSVQTVRGGNAQARPMPYSLAEIERFRDMLAAIYPLAPRRGRGSQMVKRYLAGHRYSSVVRCHAKHLQLSAQVSLALEEGLRIGEVWSLTLDRLHYDNAAVVVNTAKRKPGEVRQREVPWTAHSRQTVAEWLDFRELLSPDHDSPWLRLSFSTREPMAPQQYLALKDAGLYPFPGYRWHRFRHTFGTERLRAGMPLEKVSRLMGHVNLQQTLAYAEIVNADLVTEAERSRVEFERRLGLEAA